MHTPASSVAGHELDTAGQHIITFKGSLPGSEDAHLCFTFRSSNKNNYLPRVVINNVQVSSAFKADKKVSSVG